ncbi:hypothetical protein GBAR_LOCUS2788, partial [Geodia barretti]
SLHSCSPSFSLSISLSISLPPFSLPHSPSLSLLSLPDSILILHLSSLSPSSHSIGPKVISLRKCGISDPPTNYYLAEVVDAARNERELQPSECLYDLKQIGYYGPLKLYIRARSASDSVRGVLKVNNGQLESPISHVSVNVTNVMPASEIVAKALISFDLVVRTLYTYVQ